MRKNWSSLSASNRDEGDRHSLIQPNFPMWKKSHAKKFLALSCAALEEGWHSSFKTVLLSLVNAFNLWGGFCSNSVLEHHHKNLGLPKCHPHSIVTVNIGVLQEKDCRKHLFWHFVVVVDTPDQEVWKEQKRTKEN